MNLPPIYALAGFLGLRSDWDRFNFCNLKTLDFQNLQGNSLSEWGKNLSLNAHANDVSILMGYSLGGRIALHALIDHPSLYQAAIIISTHPGLENANARKERILTDEKWAFKFEQQEWTSLLEEWNCQTVFKGSHFQFLRKEKDFNRIQLAQQLRQGSLGLQLNLREQISRLKIPILWITGENDKKFCQLADSINLCHALSKKVIIPHTGHRAPWDDPKAFKKIVVNFLLN